jgi:hypothetical protein
LEWFRINLVFYSIIFLGVLVEVKIIWILIGERVPTLSGDPGVVSVVHLLIPVVEVILVVSHGSLGT